MANDIKQYKNIRFANRIDTESLWKSARTVLAEGELGFVKDKGYFIVGDGKNDSYAIISNPTTYAKNIYYANSSGESGGTTSYELPVASLTSLGGVRATNHRGIQINEVTGDIFSDLISTYNESKQCYEIDKLYVHHLEYTNKETTSDLDATVLTLRSNNTAALISGERSGIVVKNIYQPTGSASLVDGFLGLSANNYISINTANGTALEVVGIYPYSSPKGLVTIDDGSNYAYITPSSSLTISNMDETVSYVPENADNVTIDVSPPKMIVNGQNIEITKETVIVDVDGTPMEIIEKSYKIELDGGLTDEYIQKIKQVDDHSARLTAMERNNIATISALPTTNLQAIMTDASDYGRSIEIKHLGNQPETDSESKYIYPITNTSDPEVITVIVGIECDDTGHVTKIITRDLGWKIQSITPAT